MKNCFSAYSHVVEYSIFRQGAEGVTLFSASNSIP